MMDYLWVKALHLIAVMSWMAGLLYLPRLFVYHAQSEIGSVRSETYKLMERRLLKAIMNPAMIASWGFGLWMLHLNPGLLSMPWMWVKIACVIAMTASHMVFARFRRQFEEDTAIRKDKRYRFWNEAPTLLMIIIVIMAVVEPF